MAYSRFYMHLRPFSSALTGSKEGPIPVAKLKWFFFPQVKILIPNYICSALNIAPENKIFMIMSVSFNVKKENIRPKKLIISF